MLQLQNQYFPSQKQEVQFAFWTENSTHSELKIGLKQACISKKKNMTPGSKLMSIQAHK